jgi:hypothetical protein
MRTQNHYAPVSEAIHNLRCQGYNLDFNVEGNHFVSDGKEFSADDFEMIYTVMRGSQTRVMKL